MARKDPSTGLWYTDDGRGPMTQQQALNVEANQGPSSAEFGSSMGAPPTSPPQPPPDAVQPPVSIIDGQRADDYFANNRRAVFAERNAMANENSAEQRKAFAEGRLPGANNGGWWNDYVVPVLATGIGAGLSTTLGAGPLSGGALGFSLERGQKASRNAANQQYGNQVRTDVANAGAKQTRQIGTGAAGQPPDTSQIEAAIDRTRQVGQDATDRAAVDSVLATDQAQDYANRTAPPAVDTTNPGQQQALERAQGVTASQGASQALQGFQAPQEGIQSLRDFAAGPRGPSAAAAQLRIQAARDKRNQLALARSAQGGPAEIARAMRQAQGEIGRVAAETRGEAALLRATEEDQNRRTNLQALTSAGQLEQQGASTKVQALGEGGRQAQSATQQEIDAALAEGQLSGSIRTGDLKEGEINLSAELQTMGLNDQQVRFFSGLAEQIKQHAEQVRLNAEAQGLNAEVAVQQLMSEYRRLAWNMLSDQQKIDLERQALAQGVDFNDQARTDKWIDRALGLAGTLAVAYGSAASDRRVKTAVSPMRGVAADLRKTMGYAWNYKDPKKHGEGRHTGAMAQDLEKSKNFRGAVSTGPDGVKMVDGVRLAMAHHGVLADMQKQIDRLKKAGKRVRG